MPTKTAETIHGSVEYETVECSSCGQEIAKEDALVFAIGRGKKERYGGVKIKAKKQGYACDHCADNPIAFPRAESFIERCIDSWSYFQDDLDMIAAWAYIWMIVSTLCTAFLFVVLVGAALS